MDAHSLQFSQHERQRKMRELPVADRIVLNTTMALVSSANGRRCVSEALATPSSVSHVHSLFHMLYLGVFCSCCCRFMLIYLGLMHLMVFGIIYYSTHHVHGGCDPSLDHISPAATAAIAARLAPDTSPAAAAAVAGAVLHHR